MIRRLLDKIQRDPDHLLEYGWVFGIVFFLVLFLSQALYIWLLGSVGSITAWILLIVWSIVVSYFLLFGNSQDIFKKTHGMVTHITHRPPKTTEDKVDITKVPEVQRLKNPAAIERKPQIDFNMLEKKLESRAHDNGALISGEAIKHITSFGGGAEKVLDDVITKAKTLYPRFDGWVVLNKKQVVELLEGKPSEPTISPISREELTEPAEEKKVETKASVATVSHKESKEEVPHTPRVRSEIESEPIFSRPPKHEPIIEPKREPEQVHKPKAVQETEKKEKETELEEIREREVEIPPNLPTGVLQWNEGSATASFLQHICEGNSEGLFNFMRGMRQGSPEKIRDFLTEAILILDKVHEHRVDGAGYVEPKVLEHTRCFSNKEIEELIAILLSSVDYRYTIPEIGIKTALVRALEYTRKARRE